MVRGSELRSSQAGPVVLSGLGALLRFGQLARAHGEAFDRFALAHLDKDVIEFALIAGWIKRTERAAAITCNACHEPHIEQVLGNEGDGYWLRCPMNRRVDLLPDDVWLYRFDEEATFPALARSAGCSQGPFVEYAGGELIRLGFVADDRVAGGGWLLGLLDTTRDSADWPDIINDLSGSFGQGRCVLICHDPHLAALDLRKDVIQVHVDELLRIKGSDLTLNTPRVDMLLGLSVPSGKAGRPAKYDDPAIKVKQRLIETGNWPSSLAKQKTELLKEWHTDTDGPKPRPRSVERILKRIEKRLPDPAAPNTQKRQTRG